MRHLNAGKRLGRTTEHRQALLSNLVSALIEHEQIRTTLPKAKEARRVAEKMITLAKRSGLHQRRLAGRTIRDGKALAKLFATLGPRFSTRNGGYTRIVKLGHRLGDAADMAILEWTERAPKEAPEGGADKGSAPKKAASKKGAEGEPKQKKAEKPARVAKSEGAKGDHGSTVAPSKGPSKAPKMKGGAKKRG
ncbi:MAG: 50S ribosomal protein L17 [Deltaproteobacteria bacterium]